MLYIATEVPCSKIDAYVIVESLESDRSYLEKNLIALQTVFGKEACKKTIILLTKGEALLDNSKINKPKKNEVITKHDDLVAIATKHGAPKPILWFNNYG